MGTNFAPAPVYNDGSIMTSTTRSAVFFLVAAAAAAQSEVELKRFFEGKHVTVRMDMPGTHHGVDIHTDREPAADMGKYSSRVKQYGVAIREGDRVMVTLIRVTKKNIEFQLAGGGFGTWGDTSGLPSVPSTYISKSDREKRLEHDLARAPEPEKRRVQEQLDRERRDRQREERYARERSESLKVDRERLLLEKRREGGSRFNIWYPEGRFQESVPAPAEIMKVLAQYVDFRETGRAPSATSGARRAPVSPAQLQRGMPRDQVHAMLGKPSSSRQTKQGELTAVAERFESGDSITDVTFVGDVVVKFSITSR